MKQKKHSKKEVDHKMPYSYIMVKENPVEKKSSKILKAISYLNMTVGVVAVVTVSLISYVKYVLFSDFWPVELKILSLGGILFCIGFALKEWNEMRS